MTTYYVRKDGNDSHPGITDSAAGAWLTVQKAANTAHAGDTVYVHAGTYYESVHFDTNNGTAGNPITFRRYGTESVIINGTGVNSSGWGLLGLYQRQYLVIDGFEVCYSGTVSMVTPGILISGGSASSHITIKNCYIHHCASSGILAVGDWDYPANTFATSITIDNCDIDQCNVYWGQESLSMIAVDGFEIKNTTIRNAQGLLGGRSTVCEGLDCKEGTKNGSIHHCTSYNNLVGIYIDAGETDISNIDIYDNRIFDNVYDGLTLAGEKGGNVSGINIYNNLIYENHDRNFVVEHYEYSNTISYTFINNTLYNAGSGGICSFHDNDLTTGLIRNNIVCQDNGRYNFICHLQGTAHMTIDHNLFYNSISYTGQTNYYGTEAVFDDPDFVDAGSGDFHLQSTSPAIDAGTTDGMPPYDFEENARTNPDLGAFRYGAAANITVVPSSAHMILTGRTPLIEVFHDAAGLGLPRDLAYYQSRPNVIPLVKLELSHAGVTHTYYGVQGKSGSCRVLEVSEKTSPFSQKAEVTLENADLELDGHNYKGWSARLSYGLRTTIGWNTRQGSRAYSINDRVVPAVKNGCRYRCTVSGTSLADEPVWPETIGDTTADGTVTWECEARDNEIYTALPPLTVIGQEIGTNARMGKRDHVLYLQGIPDDLADDKAMEGYLPSESNTLTVKMIIEQLLMQPDTITSFSHCKAYNVVWDADETQDPLLAYVPGAGFRVYPGGTRMAALRRLLDRTDCALKFTDGDVHIFLPKTGEDAPLDYEYSLAKGAHTFFVKTYRDRLVNPNYIVVRSNAGDDPQYEGCATDPSHLLVEKRAVYFTALASNQQAADIAAAMVRKARLEASGGSGLAPMNIAAGSYDRVSVTDPEESAPAAGNIGWVQRRYSVKGKKWEMAFGFGGWASNKDLLETLSDEAAASGMDFQRLTVNNLYADNITANSLELNWLDSAGNIDLSKIGDNLDRLLDGTIYGKVKSAALDANGMIILDACIEGDYGKVLSSSINAGRILLSQTVKSGNWYDESGVSIDASNGIILYGSNTAFRTRGTKTGDDQCYMDSTGAICAGQGKVTLNWWGLTVKGSYLILKNSAGTRSGSIYLDDSGNIVLSTDYNVSLAGQNLVDAGQAECLILEANVGHFSEQITIPWYALASGGNGSLNYENGGMNVYASGFWHFIYYDT